MTDKEYNKKIALAALAKKKGFESGFLYNKPYLYSNREKQRWLFWLTEVQYWLMENFNIHVNAGLTTNGENFTYIINSVNKIYNTDFFTFSNVVYNDYIRALTSGIETSLKFLPDID